MWVYIVFHILGNGRTLQLAQLPIIKLLYVQTGKTRYSYCIYLSQVLASFMYVYKDNNYVLQREVRL